MLDQRLRRWPNIKPTLAECTMFEGKLSCQYIRGVSCFAFPTVIKSVNLQIQPTAKATGFYFSVLDKKKS